MSHSHSLTPPEGYSHHSQQRPILFYFWILGYFILFYSILFKGTGSLWNSHFHIFPPLTVVWIKSRIGGLRVTTCTTQVELVNKKHFFKHRSMFLYKTRSEKLLIVFSFTKVKNHLIKLSPGFRLWHHGRSANNSLLRNIWALHEL